MEDYSKLIKRCKDKEEEAIVKGTAMGAVILSRMGARYMEGSVRPFQDLALQFSPRLTSIATISEFDSFHESFVEAVQSHITERDGEDLSYGEAQKSINVFLKHYVDWSSLPDGATAKRVRPFLHVPLDSVMIGHFRRNYPQGYEKYIVPELRKINEQFKVAHPKAIKIPDRLLSELKYIYQEVYLAWQNWFREISPEKPVLLDTIWSLERETD
jgi:hypothetical protein